MSLFENVVGHDILKSYFDNIEDLKNSYIFAGPSSIGKFKMAMEIANHYSGGIRQNVHIIDSDSISVDNVRDVCNEVRIPPFMNKRRIVIINDAFKLNEISQNTLLKILETPPDKCSFFFIVESKYQLLDTIISRSECFNFSILPSDYIRKIIKDSDMKIESSLLEFIIILINGSAGKAFKLINEESTIEYYASLYDIVNKIETSKSEKRVLSISDSICENNVNQKLNDMLSWFAFKYMSDSRDIFFKYSDIISETIEKISLGANTSLSVSLAIIRIMKINEIANKRQPSIRHRKE